jgi:formylglycine-generating enzyme required for sulfatase activity
VGAAGFVRIPAGRFTMGSPAGEEGRDSDEVQHEVVITRPFLLQATEVTQGQWRALMGDAPSKFSACGADCPVERVSWYEALAYCNARSQKEGLPPCYRDPGGGVYDRKDAKAGAVPSWPEGLACRGYRLPTEAEWEYAARAGTTGARHGELDAVAWYGGNSGGKTHPAGKKAPNAWELYDMLGNVWEWCWDWKGDYAGAARDPVGPASAGLRVLRGGSWSLDARGARSARRSGNEPGERNGYFGFRLARSGP